MCNSGAACQQVRILVVDNRNLSAITLSRLFWHSTLNSSHISLERRCVGNQPMQIWFSSGAFHQELKKMATMFILANDVSFTTLLTNSLTIIVNIGLRQQLCTVIWSLLHFTHPISIIRNILTICPAVHCSIQDQGSFLIIWIDDSTESSFMFMWAV